jgi:hypothetical protein
MPQKQCESLMTLLPFAETVLRDHGEFRPFGGVVDNTGITRMIGGWANADCCRPVEVIHYLRNGMIRDAQAGQIVATAILYDAMAIPPGLHENASVITVEVCHRAGFALTVVFPYYFHNRQLVIAKGYTLQNMHPVFRRH